MGKCSLCSNTEGFHYGVKGKNSYKTKILFVLNKPDSRIFRNALPTMDPYFIAFAETRTGKQVMEMLDYCELRIDDIYMTNSFKCVLRKNWEPSIEEYKRCFNKHLKKQIQEFNPKKTVVFGQRP